MVFLKFQQHDRVKIEFQIGRKERNSEFYSIRSTFAFTFWFLYQQKMWWPCSVLTVDRQLGNDLGEGWAHFKIRPSLTSLATYKYIRDLHNLGNGFHFFSIDLMIHSTGPDPLLNYFSGWSVIILWLLFSRKMPSQPKLRR